MSKVLLVEDDNNLREIFEMRLQAEGYDTVTASDGEEALVVAMKQKPDLIIADVMMPKLSGFEMLETLRAAPEMNDVKVIMMTALGQAEDRVRGDKLGVVKYLVKSQVTLEDFVRVVREVVEPGTGSAAGTSPDNPVQNDKATNKESEKVMDDSQAQNNTGMAPAGDAPAPAPADSGNPISDGSASSAMPASDGQMSSQQQQDVVTGQVNDFVASAPAGDAGAAPAADAPAADAPAMDAGAGAMPPASPPMPESGDSAGAPAPGSSPEGTSDAQPPVV